MKFFQKLPRGHIVTATLVTLFLGLTLVLVPGERADALRISRHLALPPAPPLREVEATPPLETMDPGQWIRTTVRPGDNLATLFKRHGIPARDLQILLRGGERARELRRIYPGQDISLQVDRVGRLLAMRYARGPLEQVAYTREASGFRAEHIIIEPETFVAYREATIDQSLFVASQNIGLDDEITMRLAAIFQWDIDFVLDIRKGDSFHLMFEELFLDGEKLDNGRILAAEFVNRGKSYKAVLYTHQDGSRRFYAPDGRSMRKAFLRAPLEFSRISSNFNLRRWHPVLNRRVPHKGIDYAAPPGTPIRASGDGKVVKAQRNATNGRYVVIQHGEQFQTKYLHMQRFARGIRTGKRVTQGETIGYVGSSGLATGPHLHYEFLVNGTHRNPRTIELPKAEPIASVEREQFLTTTSLVLTTLAGHRKQHQLALGGDAGQR
ncbi:MAG: peptidoglycan DD-metalloendopeptidase family protein [Pseudomonadales bacterium]